MDEEMPQPIPELSPELSIARFPEGDGQGAYLVTLRHLHFRVSPAVKVALDTLLAHAAGAARGGEAGADVRSAAALARRHFPPEFFAGSEPAQRRTPFIVSCRLLPPRVLRRVTTPLERLFSPRLAVVLAAAFLALHAAVSVRMVLAPPAPLDAVGTGVFAGLFLLGCLCHELGHAAACHRFGARCGGIGIGVYLVFPVFYADVTEAWRLPRRQRLAVDAGGLYLQSVFLIAVDGWALAAGSPVATGVAWATTLAMLHTLNPFLKFDGYWLLSDFSGVANLHARVRELLAAPRAGSRGGRVIPPRGRREPYLLLPYALMSVLFAGGFAFYLLARLCAGREQFLSRLDGWAPRGAGAADVLAALPELASICAVPLLLLLGAALYLVRTVRFFQSR